MVGSYHITLAGIISDEAFHKSLSCIKYLEQQYPKNVTSSIHQFFPAQWDQYLKKIQNQLKNEFYEHKTSPLVFIDNKTYIGGEESFLEWALQEFRYVDKTSSQTYRQLAADTHSKAINETPGRSYVYLDISIANQVTQRVVIELFEDICPKTCENFKSLCIGYQKLDQKTNHFIGEKLQYANTEFHRVVKGMYIQGGDISKIANSNNGFSIYDGEFADESFVVNHTEPGLVGMCKRGSIPHTNECQFYITLGAPLSFLDSQNVLFGRIIEGFRVFKLIEKMELINNERPDAQQKIKIDDSGIYIASKDQK